MTVRPPGIIARYSLERDEDVSGVSGTGRVADVVEFPNGKVVVAFRSEIPSVIVYDSLDDVRTIHGHDGKTRLERQGWVG